MIIVESDSVGRIKSVVSYPTTDEAVLNLPLYKDRLFLPVGAVVRYDMDYVNDGEVLARPESTAVLNGLTLCNVREGATVVIEGESYTADGSDIELEFSHSGVYEVTVKDWPCLDWSVKVENKT